MIKLITFFILAFSTAAYSAEEIVFIVNDKNPVSELTTEQLSDFFLKKIKVWNDGEIVRFFDRNDVSVERKTFLRYYVKKSVRDVELFWIGQKLYTGHSAPSQVRTDSLMCSLVSRFPGAIGYISASYPTPKGVKKVSIKGFENAGKDNL